MSTFSFVLALSCLSLYNSVPFAVRSSFVAQPARITTPVAAPKTTMNMGLESLVDLVPAVPAEAHNQLLEVVNSPLFLSLRADSFGGLIGPIAGCSAVAAFIIVLAPPRVE